MKIKYNEKLIKDIARDRGIVLSSKEAKEAHENILSENTDEEEYYYMMKDYLNN